MTEAMKQIPYSHQSISYSDIKEVMKALRSDWLTQGPRIADFEDALCRYAGAKYAVAVSSGTAALHIACLAAGIETDDEVVTSSLTFLASANCILYAGGKPVFADIEPDTGNINHLEIKKRITCNTRAVIPVHFSGLPCNMQEIKKIAAKSNLIVIEDAAHALGARYQGSKIGSCRFSDMAILSFHPLKSITTGEGGAILTNNREFYKKLLVLRNHGITKVRQDFINKDSGEWYYEMQELGFNYRITDIQTALGVSQLKKLSGFIKRRREIAKMYQKYFAGNPYFDIPDEKKYHYSAYHLFPIRLNNKFKKMKKDIFCKLKDKRLRIQVHYIPVYMQPYYRRLGFKPGLCPNAEDFYSREISLPIYPALRDRQVKYVINTVLKVFRQLDN